MAERIIEIDEDGNVSIPLDPLDEITQLKADLARCEAKGKRMYEREHKGKMDAMHTLTTTLKPLLKDLSDAKAYLAKHGGHTATCACLQENWPPRTSASKSG